MKPRPIPIHLGIVLCFYLFVCSAEINAEEPRSVKTVEVSAEKPLIDLDKQSAEHKVERTSEESSVPEPISSAEDVGIEAPAQQTSGTQEEQESVDSLDVQSSSSEPSLPEKEVVEEAVPEMFSEGSGVGDPAVEAQASKDDAGVAVTQETLETEVEAKPGEGAPVEAIDLDKEIKPVVVDKQPSERSKPEAPDHDSLKEPKGDEAAAELTVAEHKPEPSELRQMMDSLWSLPVLYRNPENHYLKELRLVGRYQGQYQYTDSRQGHSNEWDDRRIRFGFYGEALNNVNFRVTYEYQSDTEDSNQNLDYAWVSWRPSNQFGVKAGLQKPLWSQEWSYSSRFMKTFERSQLVNQLSPEKSYGVYASGQLDAWGYGIGLFSGDAESGLEDAGDYFLLLNIGRDLQPIFLDIDKLHWRLDWIWNQDSKQFSESNLKHLVASGMRFGKGAWDVSTSVMFSSSSESNSDTYGLSVLPSYRISDSNFELVGRYQLAYGEDDGLNLQGRYEAEKVKLPKDYGDRYHAIYLGLNYYIYGDKLKIMNGVEYSNMRSSNSDGDYEGCTFISGIRMYF